MKRSKVRKIFDNAIMGGITVRTFYPNPDGGFPLKKLYGFLIDPHTLQLSRISKEELEISHNTDASSGDKLEPEPLVEYC